MTFHFQFNTRVRKPFILVLIASASIFEAHAQQDSSKKNYHLFHPTPKELMRSFETDRPDVTESPFTLDAGHLQFETDLFKTISSESGNLKIRQNYFNLGNLKFGITNSLDLQLVFESFRTEKNSANNFIVKSSFSEISVRVKQNLWGNDEGKTAFAIFPFVNIPTSSGGQISGGLILPFSIILPNGWGFGAQIETDLVENNLSNGHHLNLLASATASHSLFKNCGFFAEHFLSHDDEMKKLEYFIDGGLVYNFGKNFKLDTGFNYGVKKTSVRIYFVGLSFRI